MLHGSKCSIATGISCPVFGSDAHHIFMELYTGPLQVLSCSIYSGVVSHPILILGGGKEIHYTTGLFIYLFLTLAYQTVVTKKKKKLGSISPEGYVVRWAHSEIQQNVRTRTKFGKESQTQPISPGREEKTRNSELQLMTGSACALGGRTRSTLPNTNTKAWWW